MNFDVLRYLYDVAVLAWQLHHAVRNRIIPTKAVKRRSICSEKDVSVPIQLQQKVVASCSYSTTIQEHYRHLHVLRPQILSHAFP